MNPTVKPGSVSLIVPQPAENVKVGDIVAFRSPEDSSLTIIHRIINIKSRDPLIFESKGDNNNAPDLWDVRPDNIIGKHVFSMPLLGNLIAYIKKPLGFVAIIVIPALLLLLAQLRNIKLGIDEEVNRRVKKLKEEEKRNTHIMNSIIIMATITAMFAVTSTKEATALFMDQISIANLTVTMKDFAPPPVPTLISPENNSLLNTNGLVMKWEAVTDFENMHNPVYYYYQSSHNKNFAPLAYSSGKLANAYIPAPGTPDGIYWWRVRACDSIDNCSEWSKPMNVTVDSTAPKVDFTNIRNNQVLDDNTEIRGSVTDAHPHHYWFVIQNSKGSKVAGPGTVTEKSSFTDNKLLTWNTTKFADGKYTLKLEARDAADNKSNSLSVKWLTVWVENEASVEIETPIEGAVYHLGDTVHMKWKLKDYEAPGDLYATLKISTDGGTTYKDIKEDLKNDFEYDWDIPNDSDYKTSAMRLKVVVRNEYGNSFSGESGLFDPVEDEATEKLEEKTETKSEKVVDDETVTDMPVEEGEKK